MGEARDLLKELYEALRASEEVHPHLLSCSYCAASIHGSRVGRAMSDVFFYLKGNPDPSGISQLGDPWED